MEKDVSDNFLGKKVKCPSCEHKFVFESLAPTENYTLGTIIDKKPQMDLHNDISKSDVDYQPHFASAVEVASEPGAREREDWAKPYAEPQKKTPLKNQTGQPLRSGLRDFLERTSERDRAQGEFELESDRMLELNLNKNGVWIQTGSMIAYRGDIRFRREGILEFGIKRLFKRALTGEGITLTRAEGSGKLYVADQAKQISIIQLKNEAIVVNGTELLAFSDGIHWDVKFMKSLGAWIAGGLFSFRLKGEGTVAIATHFEPLTLRVGKEGVSTDPQATVAWSEQLKPELKTDIQFKTFFGRGSGETVQMHFKGNGFVVVQPFETTPFTHRDPAAGGNRKGGTIGGIFLAAIGAIFLITLALLKRI